MLLQVVQCCYRLLQVVQCCYMLLHVVQCCYMLLQVMPCCYRLCCVVTGCAVLFCLCISWGIWNNALWDSFKNIRWIFWTSSFFNCLISRRPMIFTYNCFIIDYQTCINLSNNINPMLLFIIIIRKAKSC